VLCLHSPVDGSHCYSALPHAAAVTACPCVRTAGHACIVCLQVQQTHVRAQSTHPSGKRSAGQPPAAARRHSTAPCAPHPAQRRCSTGIAPRAQGSRSTPRRRPCKRKFRRSASRAFGAACRLHGDPAARAAPRVIPCSSNAHLTSSNVSAWRACSCSTGRSVSPAPRQRTAALLRLGAEHAGSRAQELRRRLAAMEKTRVPGVSPTGVVIGAVNHADA
jgi:hypothetical protein